MVESNEQIRVVLSERADDAIAIDRDHRGDEARADYIVRCARGRGLFVAYAGEQAIGFVCLETAGFFGRPFISLLVVARAHRRHGVGATLLTAAEGSMTKRRLFTSTSQSNEPMNALFRQQGYTPCGSVSGLDENDPELFYYKDLV
jgi:GNAT superfamily N-acetyltransferase